MSLERTRNKLPLFSKYAKRTGKASVARSGANEVSKGAPSGYRELLILLRVSMADREAAHRLCGAVEVDDAYLGGERAGGKPGRGSENKAPAVAAVSLSDKGHPLYVKVTQVPGVGFPSMCHF